MIILVRPDLEEEVARPRCFRRTGVLLLGHTRALNFVIRTPCPLQKEAKARANGTNTRERDLVDFVHIIGEFACATNLGTKRIDRVVSAVSQACERRPPPPPPHYALRLARISILSRKAIFYRHNYFLFREHVGMMNRFDGLQRRRIFEPNIVPDITWSILVKTSLDSVLAQLVSAPDDVLFRNKRVSTTERAFSSNSRSAPALFLVLGRMGSRLK
jgi:hypothetical protein